MSKEKNYKPLKRSVRKKIFKTKNVSQKELSLKLDGKFCQLRASGGEDVINQNSVDDILNGGGKFFSR